MELDGATETGLIAGRDVHQRGTYVAGRDINLVVDRSTPPPARRQLPRDIPEFTGRADEILELSDVLCRVGQAKATSVPVAVIRDGPGIGKSALAVHVAHRLVPFFPDAQLHVQLSGEKLPTLPPENALETLLRSLGLDGDSIPAGLEARQALFRSELADQRALLVLDNAISEAQVRPLLPGSATCAVLVTSRRQLDGLQGVHMLDLTRLSDAEGQELLRQLIGDERFGSDPEAALSIVGLCGNLPLAIQLAGASLRTTARRRVPLRVFAAQLADERKRLNLLKAGDREIRASFALSYETLSEGAKRLFRRYGLLRVPDSSDEVLVALAASWGGDADELRDELVNAHLLEVTGADGDRFRFHDLVRLFAVECADESESAAQQLESLQQAFSWYLAGARYASSCIDPSQVGADAEEGSSSDEARFQAALNWFERERASLVAVVNQAHEVGEDELAWTLAATLVGFFEIHNYWNDWAKTQSVALASARQAGNEEAEAWALFNLAGVARLQRHTAEATSCYQGALEIFRRLDDQRGQGMALSSLGMLHRERHRFDEAVAAFEGALAIFRQTGNHRGAVQALNNLGHVYRYQHRFEDSIDCHQQALAGSRRIGDRHGEAWALNNLIVVCRLDGRHDDALGYFQQVATLVARMGYTHAEAWALNHVGAVYRDQGRLDEAADHHRRALSTFRELGDGYGAGRALNHLGKVHRMLADLDAAARHVQEAREEFRLIGDSYNEALALGELGRILRLQGNTRDAVASLDRALATMRALNDDARAASVLRELGHCHLDHGDRRSAVERFREALELYERCGARREADELFVRLRSM
jgi:tetratricopeptide (TPR) repeat protein